MPVVATHAPGTFCWFELGTTDQAAAKEFYRSLFGWSTRDMPMPEGVYTIFTLNDKDVGACYTLMKEQLANQVPPHWLDYVSVENVDASLARAVELGGRTITGPMDVQDFGRMGVAQDPAGAVFALWQDKGYAGVGIVGEIGTQCWSELLTRDTAKASAFYTGLLGWKAEEQRIGDTLYTTFSNATGAQGGMMAIAPDMGPLPPSWTTYFSVADCDAAVEKARSLGAEVVVPAMDVPTVGRFAGLQDPQGAHFSVIRLIPPAA